MNIRRALHVLIGEDEPGSQAPPPVATTMSPPAKKPTWWRSRMLGTVLLAGVVAGLLALVVLYKAPPPPQEGPQMRRGAAARVGPVVNTELPEAQKVAAAAPAPTPPAGSQGASPPPPPPAKTLDDKVYAQGFAAFGGNAKPKSGGAGAAAPAAPGSGDERPDAPPSAMDAALRVGRSPTATARRVSNPHLKMRPNTPIECAMDNVTDNGTGLVSGSCTTTQPGWSMTGAVAVIPRDSTITIRGERVMQGNDTRIMLTAATAIVQYDTFTDPIEIDIMAAVSDALGATGVQGRRDDRTWDRVKNAVLLGISGEASQRAVGRLTADNLPGSGAVRGAATAGSRGLRYETSISPHVTVRQGEAIAIVLQGYADFSNQVELVEVR